MPLGRVSPVSYQQATLPSWENELWKGICLVYPRIYNNKELPWVCMCLWGKGLYEHLILSIRVLSIIKTKQNKTKPKLLLLSYSCWLRLKTKHVKSYYRTFLPLPLSRNIEKSNLWVCSNLAQLCQIMGVCGLFVIIGPLTVSAVLISLRWLLPNPGKVQVVQSVLAALRQRVKEVNWISKCPQ